MTPRELYIQNVIQQLGGLVAMFLLVAATLLIYLRCRSAGRPYLLGCLVLLLLASFVGHARLWLMQWSVFDWSSPMGATAVFMPYLLRLGASVLLVMFAWKTRSTPAVPGALPVATTPPAGQ